MQPNVGHPPRRRKLWALAAATHAAAAASLNMPTITYAPTGPVSRMSMLRVCWMVDGREGSEKCCSKLLDWKSRPVCKVMMIPIIFVIAMLVNDDLDS